MIIAIDGPAASGKGTIARALAVKYGLAHLDTGLLYRAVGLAVLERLDETELERFAVAAAKKIDTEHLDRTRLGSAEIALAAAKVARFEPVRAVLRKFQRDFAHQDGGAVLDGRDIGTRICPDADVKFFITAQPEERARRRRTQLLAEGNQIGEHQILSQILQRDKSDRENPAGAFYMAQGAHLLDTTQLDIEAALRLAIEIIDGATSHKMDLGSDPN